MIWTIYRRGITKYIEGIKILWTNWKTKWTVNKNFQLKILHCGSFYNIYILYRFVSISWIRKSFVWIELILKTQTKTKTKINNLYPTGLTFFYPFRLFSTYINTHSHTHTKTADKLLWIIFTKLINYFKRSLLVDDGRRRLVTNKQ